jgi:Putative prokaryotic signal transducing protein
MNAVRLTIVANQLEAEMVLGALRSAGIECADRLTDFAAGAWDGFPGAGGPREILVRPEDLGVAREVLTDARGA